jgi:hypothetical protein
MGSRAELTLTRRLLHWSQPWRDFVCARRGGISETSVPESPYNRLARILRDVESPSAGREDVDGHVDWNYKKR